jgi:ubiquinone/menaquinone biosynthesis C-methylase UbiE
MIGVFLHKYFRESLGRNLLNEEIKKNAHLLNGAILDVGSGSRRYDHYFKGQITAIDLIENDQKKIFYGDIHALPFSDQTFDHVVCFEVLCYSNNVQKALKELVRVSKQDAFILLSMPVFLRDSGDRVRLTKRYLEELLLELNISRFEITECGNAWTIMWDILRTMILETRHLARKLSFYFLALPPLLIILLFRLHKIQTPLYVAEHFILIKK